MRNLMVSSQYSRLSRGRISARKEENGQTVWADKNDSSVILTPPGRWKIHTSDGFSREARCEITLKLSEEGRVSWSYTGGESSRFSVRWGEKIS